MTEQKIERKYAFAKILARKKSDKTLEKFITYKDVLKKFSCNLNQLQQWINQEEHHPTHEFSYGYGTEMFVIGEKVKPCSNPDAMTVLMVSNLGHFYIMDHENPDESRRITITSADGLGVMFRDKYYLLPYEVAAAFHPTFDRSTQKIWFLDGDTYNCCIDNLCPIPKDVEKDQMVYSRKDYSKNIKKCNYDFRTAGHGTYLNGADEKKILALYKTGLYTFKNIQDMWGISRDMLIQVLRQSERKYS